MKIKKSNDIRVLGVNILSLFILKGSDYILPLILLPYLVRVIGIEYFGLLAFATATIGFARGIVAYGFDLSGTKQIAQYRDDKNKLIEIYSSILVVKSLLFLVVFVVFILILMFVDKFTMHWEVYFFTLFIVLGDVLFPVWYFQGLEKMKLITYIRLTYKLLFVISVLFLVKSENDYMLVPLLDSLGAIAAGIFSLYIIMKKFNTRFILPSYQNIVFQFQQGWHIFLSQISVFMYSSINTFLLGILTTNEAVGFYTLAYKIYLALRGLLNPLVQALYPYLSKLYIKDVSIYYKKVRLLSLMFFAVLLFFSICTYIFKSNIILFVSGKLIPESIDILSILLYVLPFAIGSFYSTLLIIKSQGKILLKITLISMIINMILVYPAIYFYGIYGLAWQFLIVQIVQSTLQIKYNIEIWRS